MTDDLYEAGWNDALKSREVRAMLAALKDVASHLERIGRVYNGSSTAQNICIAIAAAKAAGIKED